MKSIAKDKTIQFKCLTALILIFLYYFIGEREAFNIFFGEAHNRFAEFFRTCFYVLQGDPYHYEHLTTPPFSLMIGNLFALLFSTDAASVADVQSSMIGRVWLGSFLFVCIAPLIFLLKKFFLKNFLSNPYQALFCAFVTCVILPYLTGIDLASFNLLAFPLFFAFLMTYKEKPEISAVFLGVLVSIYGYAILLVVLFICHKQFKEIAITAITALFLSIYPLFIFEGGFISNITTLFGNLGVHFTNYDAMRGGIFSLAFLPFHNARVDVHLFQYANFIFATCFVVCMILSVFAVSALKREVSFWKQIYVLSLLMILINPYADESLMFFMVFPILLFLSQSKKNKSDYIYVVAFLIIIAPKNFLVYADFSLVPYINTFTAFSILLYYLYTSLYTIQNVYQGISNKLARMSKYPHVLCIIGIIIICSIYIFAVYDKTMPLAEGWYSYYAKKMNQGLLPYRDFEYLYTPIYLYIIKGFTYLFSYDLISLRILGAILFIVIAILCYLIFSRVFSPVASLMGASATVLYFQSEVVQIFYDYIRFMDLFVYIALLSMLIFVKDIKKSYNAKSAIILAVSGFFSGLAFLTKQNSGGIIAAYYFILLVFFLILLPNKKAMIMNLFTWGISVLMPIGLISLFLYQQGSLNAFIHKASSDALAAKGGMSTVLFRWIFEAIPIIFVQRKYIFIILLFILISCFLTYKCYKKYTKSSQATLGFLFFLLAAGSMTLCVKSSMVMVVFNNLVNGMSAYTIFAVVTILLAFVFVLIVFRKRLIKTQYFKHLYDFGEEQPVANFYFVYFTLAGAIFALGYGVGTSGGLAESQVALAMGLIIGTLLLFSQHRFKVVSSALIVSLCLGVCLTSSARKLITTYSWWGLSEPAVWALTETADVPHLNGIYMSRSSKEMYEKLYAGVTKYTTPEDNVFAFPHIPLFYVLTDRDPKTFSYVQWFDVSSDRIVKNDINSLKNDHPAAIILCEVPEFVINSHEANFRSGKVSGLHEMQDFLKSFVQIENYTCVYTKNVPNGYKISLYIEPSKAPKTQQNRR